MPHGCIAGVVFIFDVISGVLKDVFGIELILRYDKKQRRGENGGAAPRKRADVRSVN